MPRYNKFRKGVYASQEEYDAVMDEADELREEIRRELDGAYDDYRRVERRFSTLPDRMEDIRERGYLFMPEMEPELVKLEKKWEGISPRVVKEFDNFTLYRGFGSQVNFLIDAGFFGYDRFGLEQLRDAKERASQLNSRVSSLISPVGNPLSRLTYLVDHTNRMLTDLKGATFKLVKDEKPGWYEKNDIIWGGRTRKCKIFFTSKRVIFEERASGIFSKKNRKPIYSYPLDDFSGFDVDRGFLGIGDKVTMKFTTGDAVAVKVGDPDRWVARTEKIVKPEFYTNIYSKKTKTTKTAARGDTGNVKEVKRLRKLLDKLDEQLVMGKISEKTYKELRSKYENQLSKLL